MPDQLSFVDLELPRRVAHRPMGDVFYVVRPDEQAAAQYADIATRLQKGMGLKGEIIHDRFHVTLHCIGTFPLLSDYTLNAAMAAAAAVSMPPFEIAFDRVRSFDRSAGKLPLVLVGPEHDGPVRAFRRTLDMALRRVGGVPRMSAHFLPHLTLMYGDRTVPEQMVEKVGWTVRDFVLIHSHYGHGRHEVIGQWPLREIRGDEP